MVDVTTTSADALLLADRINPAGAFERIVGSPAHDWQRDVLLDRSKRICLLCARQVGKSETARAMALVRACTRSNQAIGLVCHHQDLAYTGLQAMRDALVHFPYVKAINSARGELALDNGSVITGFSAGIDVCRGRTLDMLVADEASRLDDQVFTSVIPALTIRQGTLIIASTPVGERGYFAEVVTSGDPEWSRYAIKGSDSPNYTEASLAALKRALGKDRFETEFNLAWAITGSGIPIWDDIELALLFGDSLEQAEEIHAAADAIPAMRLPALADLTAAARLARRGD